MARNDKDVTTVAPKLTDAVAFGLSMRLPEDALTKYAVGKWTALKAEGEHVDDSGQRWISVRMPIGPRVHHERSDKVQAVAVVKSPDGYLTVRLELPLQVASDYAVETEGPDQRGFAVDAAQRMIADGADAA